MAKKETNKKTLKLMEKAMNLQQVLDEVSAELTLVKIKLQKELNEGETGEFMGHKFQHKAGSVRTRLDGKALQQAHPTIYEEFVVTSETKGSLAIIKPK